MEAHPGPLSQAGAESSLQEVNRQLRSQLEQTSQDFLDLKEKFLVAEATAYSLANQLQKYKCEQSSDLIRSVLGEKVLCEKGKRADTLPEQLRRCHLLIKDQDKELTRLYTKLREGKDVSQQLVQHLDALLTHDGAEHSQGQGLQGQLAEGRRLAKCLARMLNPENYDHEGDDDDDDEEEEEEGKKETTLTIVQYNQMDQEGLKGQESVAPRLGTQLLERDTSRDTPDERYLTYSVLPDLSDSYWPYRSSAIFSPEGTQVCSSLQVASEYSIVKLDQHLDRGDNRARLSLSSAVGSLGAKMGSGDQRPLLREMALDASTCMKNPPKLERDAAHTYLEDIHHKGSSKVEARGLRHSLMGTSSSSGIWYSSPAVAMEAHPGPLSQAGAESSLQEVNRQLRSQLEQTSQDFLDLKEKFLVAEATAYSLANQLQKYKCEQSSDLIRSVLGEKVLCEKGKRADMLPEQLRRCHLLIKDQDKELTRLYTKLREGKDVSQQLVQHLDALLTHDGAEHSQGQGLQGQLAEGRRLAKCLARMLNPENYDHEGDDDDDDEEEEEEGKKETTLTIVQYNQMDQEGLKGQESVAPRLGTQLLERDTSRDTPDERYLTYSVLPDLSDSYWPYRSSAIFSPEGTQVCSSLQVASEYSIVKLDQHLDRGDNRARLSLSSAVGSLGAKMGSGDQRPLLREMALDASTCMKNPPKLERDAAHTYLEDIHHKGSSKVEARGLRHSLMGTSSSSGIWYSSPAVAMEAHPGPLSQAGAESSLQEVNRQLRSQLEQTSQDFLDLKEKFLVAEATAYSLANQLQKYKCEQSSDLIRSVLGEKVLCEKGKRADTLPEQLRRCHLLIKDQDKELTRLYTKLREGKDVSQQLVQHLDALLTHDGAEHSQGQGLQGQLAEGRRLAKCLARMLNPENYDHEGDDDDDDEEEEEEGKKETTLTIVQYNQMDQEGLKGQESVAPSPPCNTRLCRELPVVEENDVPQDSLDECYLTPSVDHDLPDTWRPHTSASSTHDKEETFEGLDGDEMALDASTCMKNPPKLERDAAHTYLEDIHHKGSSKVEARGLRHSLMGTSSSSGIWYSSPAVAMEAHPGPLSQAGAESSLQEVNRQLRSQLEQTSQDFLDLKEKFLVAEATAYSLANQLQKYKCEQSSDLIRSVLGEKVLCEKGKRADTLPEQLSPPCNTRLCRELPVVEENDVPQDSLDECYLTPSVDHDLPDTWRPHTSASSTHDKEETFEGLDGDEMALDASTCMKNPPKLERDAGEDSWDRQRGCQIYGHIKALGVMKQKIPKRTLQFGQWRLACRFPGLQA
ncbi:neuroblastoma breakpoint family member 12-like [Meles meles]|uniref:neuroblastoma breakpoint family member 12-like n=1 Tax=Meles meles TaxID=9662 RepID=UPI001E69BB4C|nr:neuroblastoma breakpoint family member 12-like [Meles meles]